MKENLRTLIGFSAILFSISLFVTAFALAADEAPAGQKLFESKCSQCHNKDGKGAVKMAKILKVDPTAVDLTRADAAKLTDDEIVKTVTNGKKKMPKFKGKLTDDQIQEVVKYLRTLQGSGASK